MAHADPATDAALAAGAPLQVLRASRAAPDAWHVVQHGDLLATVAVTHGHVVLGVLEVRAGAPVELGAVAAEAGGAGARTDVGASFRRHGRRWASARAVVEHLDGGRARITADVWPGRRTRAVEPPPAPREAAPGDTRPDVSPG